MLLKGFLECFVKYVKDRWLKLLMFLRGIKKEKNVLKECDFIFYGYFEEVWDVCSCYMVKNLFE